MTSDSNLLELELAYQAFALAVLDEIGRGENIDPLKLAKALGDVSEKLYAQEHFYAAHILKRLAEFGQGRRDLIRLLETIAKSDFPPPN